MGNLLLRNDRYVVSLVHVTRYPSPFFLATMLAIIFFRHVGIVGEEGDAHGAPGPEPQPDDEKPTRQSSLTVSQSRDLEKMLNSP